MGKNLARLLTVLLMGVGGTFASSSHSEENKVPKDSRPVLRISIPDECLWEFFLKNPSKSNLIKFKELIKAYEDEKNPGMSFTEDSIINEFETEDFACVNGEGESLLMYLIKLGKKDLIQYLLDVVEFDLEVKNHKGQTALFMAFLYGRMDMAKMFIEKNAYTDVQDNDGEFLLSLAVKNINKEMFLYLLENGADLELVHPQTKETVLFDFIKTYLALNPKEQVKRSELQTMLEASLKKGINLSHKNYLEQTVLFEAVCGDRKLLSLLNENGDLKKFVNDKDQYGWTVLTKSITCDRIENLKYLIEIGANVNTANNRGISPLFLAVKKGWDFMEILLKNGANTNVKEDIYRTTPLMVAAERLERKKIELLLSYPTEVSLRNRIGQTALIIAAGKDPELFPDVFSVVGLLLQKGSYVNARDYAGRTALSYALEFNKDSEVVSVLKAAGGTL